MLPQRLRRSSGLRGASIALLTVLLLAGSGVASAAPVAVPNACQYSAAGNDYRNHQLTFDASIAPVYGTSSAAEPGEPVRTSASPVDIELPEYLARFGYQLQMLHEGPNTVNVKVWVALEASNTVERVQLVGPLTTTATTTIEVDHSTETAYPATWTYTKPQIPALTWTAAGTGPVVVRQAPPGSISEQLPIGPPLDDQSPAPRTVTGSVVVRVDFVPSGFMSLDCRPGSILPPIIDEGSGSYAPAVSGALATLAASSNNQQCLSEAGRLVSGASAVRPSGVTRELDAIAASFSGPGALANGDVGVAKSIGGISANVTLPAATVTALANTDVGGQPLLTSGTSRTLEAWVTLRGTNTTPATQTVKATATFTPVETGGSWQPATLALAFADSTWTPTGGPISLSLAAPGDAGAIDVTGQVTGGPGGAVATATFPTKPYGTLLLRVPTDFNPVSLDCFAGAAKIVSGATAWASGGAVAAPTGSLGRYGITAAAGTPAVLASAEVDGAPLTPPATATPTPTATVTPTVTPTPSPAPTVTRAPEPTATPAVATPTPRVVATPAPTPAAGNGLLTVASKDLRLSGARSSIRLTCAQGRDCIGRLELRSTSKVRLGTRASKVLVLVKAVEYVLPAGRTTTVRLGLTADARAALRTRKSIATTFTATPLTGAKVVKRLTLRR